MRDRKKEYVVFTKICGDCGRRFNMDFEMPKWNLETKKGQKEAMKFVKFMFPMYNVCCNKCNEKKNESN